LSPTIRIHLAKRDRIGARSSFVLRLALREGRSALRRIGVFAGSIALGVGALVTIHGFREDMSAALEDEAETLLGADVRVGSNQPFPESVTGFVAALGQERKRSSSVTTVISMVMAPRTEVVRLLQVRGIEGAYPFYGTVRSDPADAWQRLSDGEPGIAVVDPAVLDQLGIVRGDSLVLGDARFVVAGTVQGLPTDLGFETAAGPRVHISQQDLQRTGLLTFGSLARYELFVEVPDEDDQRRLRSRFDDAVNERGVRFTTAEAQVDDLTDAVEWLGRYLGLVGLAALLLGAVGVASAVHVFVKEKLTTVAVLRCLGARQGEVFAVYVVLTAALGLLGSVVGALLGLLAQKAAPGLLASVLPVEVTTRPHLGVAALGVAIGLWVSVLFALGPLLTVRDVPPLMALRQDFESKAARRDRARWLVAAALLLTVGLLAVWEAPVPEQGLAFATGVAAVAVLLWGVGNVLMAITRRALPRGAPYPVRQGVANLFRPRNQTVAVTLALGFGAFVVGTLLQVQSSVTDALSLEGEDTPNLVLFDIQPDQTDGVMALLPEDARAGVEVAPLVPARITRVQALDPGRRPERWALRREYRNTWRDTLSATETIAQGSWFDALPPRDSAGAARISMETDLAQSLAVTVGDSVFWDVGGVAVSSVITSLREVDWGRFATNFFVVFEPGVLEAAPRMDVVLARIPDSAARGAIQRRLITEYPNVSALDVDQLQATLGSILGKVGSGVRFLALACALAGSLVLLGALSTSRYQRTREAALLRTLGARRRQVTGVLLTEYAALGTVSALAGLLLSAGAASWIVRATMDLSYDVDFAVLAQVWVGITALTVAMGFLMSLPVLRRPPLPVLREISE
jgi:putative ABC transport system permease protein